MKEVFYNFLIFICFCNISILQSNFINSKYINLNSVPYQEAKISFGLGLINNNTTNFSLSFQNWFTDNLLGIVIALAMILNLFIAGLAGTIIPLSLQRMNIAPALASGVILTTITDVFGFLSFLGLASILLI